MEPVEPKSNIWFWVLPPVAVGLLVIGLVVWQQRRTPPRSAPPEPSPRTDNLPLPSPRVVESHPHVAAPQDSLPEPLPPPPPSAVSRPEPFTSIEEADAALPAAAAGLSNEPHWQRWLGATPLVRRFVAAVDCIAHGISPREYLDVVTVTGPFAVASGPATTVVRPSSWARYDAIVRVFTSLDTQACGELYRRLQPALDAAYADMGYTDRTFRHALREAAIVLLQVPVTTSAPRLVRSGQVWRYADPALERLDPAQKHLLRMGPANTRAVHMKIRELAAAIDVELPE